MAQRTSFVGREAELAELEAQWRLAAGGAFRCVLLVGEPGVGKTRLADEAGERHGSSATVLRARARPLSGTASFGLWAEALESHLRELPAEEVGRLCGGLVDVLASLLHSVAAVRGAVPHREPPRPRMLDSLGTLLAKLAQRRPVALVLNDLHQADASSWEVLPYLAERLAGERIVVLATARTAELADHTSALRALLDVEEQGALRRMEIGPLPDAALRELAADILGGPAGREVLDWLWDRSRGNPLFAVGLLHALRDEGVDPAHPGLRHLPEELTARVRARVELLDAPTQAVLEVLAVVGGRAELGELTRFGEEALPELAPLLHRLVRSRLVVEEERGRVPAYEITHPLIQEMIYEEIGGARRFALHRHVGRTLLGMGRLGEAALHFASSAETGDDEAIEVLREALRQAEGRGAFREGLTILGSLVDLLPSGDDRWAGVADALFGDADWVVDHRADAEARVAVAALREVDAVMAAHPDLARRAAIKSRLTSFLSWGTGELEEAAAAAEEAIDLHRRAGDPTRARLAALELAYARGINGNIPALEQGAADVLAEAEAAGDEDAALWAVGVKGTAAFYGGRFEAAEADLRRSVDLARRHGKHYRVTWGLMSLGWCFGFEGRLKEAYEAFAEAKAEPGWRDSNVLELEAHVRWLAGDFAGSLACVHETELHNPGLGLRRGVSLVCAALAGIEMGDVAEARRAAAGARRIYGTRTWFMASGLALHAEGMLAWREGRMDEAGDLLERGSREVMAVGAPAHATPLLVDVAEVAAEAGDRVRAEAAATAAARIAGTVDRDLHRALAHTAGAWAALAAGRPSRAAESGAAAAELLRSLDYPVLLGRALMVLGLGLEGRDPSRSLAALQEATSCFDATGSVWRRDRTLTLLRGLGKAGRRAAGAALGAPALTSREREVARLAARRLTAAEIADQLFISRRTVETHLASVYTKLGVNSRAQLARKLADPPL
ncbi:MAG: ATP-binding protein [Acidimicrobiia bacterium]